MLAQIIEEEEIEYSNYSQQEGASLRTKNEKQRLNTPKNSNNKTISFKSEAIQQQPLEELEDSLQSEVNKSKDQNYKSLQLSEKSFQTVENEQNQMNQEPVPRKLSPINALKSRKDTGEVEQASPVLKKVRRSSVEYDGLLNIKEQKAQQSSIQILRTQLKFKNEVERQPGFWEKVGIMGNKKKLYLMQLAQEQLENLDKIYAKNQQEYNKVYSEYQQIVTNEQVTLYYKNNLLDEIQNLQLNIQNEILRGQNREKEMQKERESQSMMLEDMFSRFIEVYQLYAGHLSQIATEYESNQLQAEEYYQQLAKTYAELQIRKEKHQKQIKIYEQLDYELQKEKHLEQQLEHANNQLDKVLEYLDQNEHIAQDNHQISQSMRNLKMATEDCIIAEEEFQTRATQDPKEIMPYARSNLYPATRSARPIRTPSAISSVRNIESRQSELQQYKTVN